MEGLESPEVLCLRCDVTDSDAVQSVLNEGVLHFGGLDILVSNAGNFPSSASLADMTDEAWEQSMQLNLGSHMKVLRACLPLLENGFDPAVVFVASKNVPRTGSRGRGVFSRQGRPYTACPGRRAGSRACGYPRQRGASQRGIRHWPLDRGSAGRAGATLWHER